MIESKELHRLNLVEFEGRIFEIDCIAEEAPFLKTIEFGVGVVTYENIKGITITKEILLQLSFEQDKEIPYRYHLEGCLAYDLDDNCVSIYGTWLVKRFPYLHELQNLISILTGEELPTNKILKS